MDDRDDCRHLSGGIVTNPRPTDVALVAFLFFGTCVGVLVVGAAGTKSRAEGRARAPGSSDCLCLAVRVYLGRQLCAFANGAAVTSCL